MSRPLAIAVTGLAGCVVVNLIALVLLVSGYEHAVEPLVYYVAAPLLIVGWLAFFAIPVRSK